MPASIVASRPAPQLMRYARKILIIDDDDESLALTTFVMDNDESRTTRRVPVDPNAERRQATT